MAAASAAPRAVAAAGWRRSRLLAAGWATAEPAATPSPGSPAAKPAEADGDLAQLERLLRRRAAALAAGRPRAYAATATGPQRDRDREAARNARGLGLRDVELAVDSADVSGRDATLRVRRALRRPRRPRPLRHRAPDRRAAHRRPAGGCGASPARRERHPWEVGRVRARRSRHFVVLAPRGLELGALVDALEGGYARMGTVLRKPRLRRRYLVVVAAGTQAARSLTERIRGVESLAAISDTEVQEAGSARRVTAVVSQRLVVVWPPFSTLDADGAAARRHPRAHARGARRRHLGPHARLADRGRRALRLRRPPRRRRGAVRWPDAARRSAASRGPTRSRG